MLKFDVLNQRGLPIWRGEAMDAADALRRAATNLYSRSPERGWVARAA